MGRRRDLHRAPWLIEAKIADDFRHPRARRLGLERGRRNAADCDRRRRRAGDRAADGGAPVRLILEGKGPGKTVAEGRGIGKSTTVALDPRKPK